MGPIRFIKEKMPVSQNNIYLVSFDTGKISIIFSFKI